MTDNDGCPTCDSVMMMLRGDISTPEGPVACADPWHDFISKVNHPHPGGLIPGQVTYVGPNDHIRTGRFSQVREIDLIEKGPRWEGPTHQVLEPKFPWNFCPRCGMPKLENAYCGDQQCRKITDNIAAGLGNPYPEPFSDKGSKFFSEGSQTQTWEFELTESQARALQEKLGMVPEGNAGGAEAPQGPNDARDMIHISEDDFKTLILKHQPMLSHLDMESRGRYICSCQTRELDGGWDGKPWEHFVSTWLIHFTALLMNDWYHPSKIAEREKKES